jgi:uncharacterized protein YdhG (YjbR/CyaY superfamily)
MDPFSLLKRGLSYHDQKVKKATEGITQAEALFRPYNSANSLLWEVGHLAFFRNTYIKLLNPTEKLEKLPNETALFGFGSTNHAPEVYPSRESVVAAFLARGQRIDELLATVSPEHWESNSPINFPGGKTVGSQIEFLMLHEAMHSGELMYISTLIRRLR